MNRRHLNICMNYFLTGKKLLKTLLEPCSASKVLSMRRMVRFLQSLQTVYLFSTHLWEAAASAIAVF